MEKAEAEKAIEVGIKFADLHKALSAAEEANARARRCLEELFELLVSEKPEENGG